MKRIAIPMITLMAGGILAAQITPQAAQSIQSQARTGAKSAPSPISASPAKSPTPAAVKPVPSAKSSSTATSKPTAQSTVSAKPSAITPSAVRPVPTSAQSRKTPVPAAPTKMKPAVATAKTAAPKSAPPVAAPKPAVQKAAKIEQPRVKEAMVKTESPAPEPKPVINLTSRRDPFTSPVTRALAVNQGPGCSTGKRCLAVDQMILRGIVRSPNGMIAVVENGAKRAYFLRENDPVWHGTVVKINGDSVVFREDTVDSKTGKASTHEVVKRVNAPVV
jgi:Tfp pilus assembly protein PilP